MPSASFDPRSRAIRETALERVPRGPSIRLRVERLEDRLLMTQRTDPDAEWQLSHGGACGCSICAGFALASVPDEIAAPAAAGGLSPLTSLPQLNSLPGARATLYLDFDGYRVDRWGSYTNISAGVFDRDGNPTTFSESELQAIREIWGRTAEDYSPFQVNVTTVDPGYEAERTTARIVVGGHWRDWFGESAGGIAYIGGFYNSSPNVGFAFEDALGNGNPRYVAEAVSHEAGHLFGLQHQSLWSNGSMTSNYSSGSSLWAPIMGVSYYAQRTTWALGSTDVGSSTQQDDMDLLANGGSKLGYRADEAGNTASAAASLRPQTTSAGAATASFSVAGLIGRTADEDWYAFPAGTGSLSLDLQVAAVGANLDGVLELRNQAGRIVTTAAPGDRLGATLNADVTEGLYYAVIRGGTDYGNAGSYTLRGTVATPPPTAPVNRITPPASSRGELDLFVGNVGVPNDAPLSFGYTPAGRSVDRVLSIRNTGQGTLQLQSLDASGLPAGFKLINSLPLGPLAPGRTASLRIRLNSPAAGNQSGQIRLTSNDADEGQLVLRLEGTVTPGPIVVDDADAAFQASGVWNPLRTGRGRNTLVAAAGGGETTASWNFPGLLPGQYRVYATWSASPLLATDASFTLLSEQQVLGSVQVNQEQPPAGFSAGGSPWSSLTTVNLTGNQLTVRLTNAANDRVAADAIRVEWAGPAAENGLLHKTNLAEGATRIPDRLVAAAFARRAGETHRGAAPDEVIRWSNTSPVQAFNSSPRSVANSRAGEMRLNLVMSPASDQRLTDRAPRVRDHLTVNDQIMLEGTPIEGLTLDRAILDPMDWLALPHDGLPQS